MIKQLIGITFLILFSGTVFAGSSEEGGLSQPHFMSTGIVLVTQNGSRSSAPACATIPQRWAINASTAAGKVQLSGLLTAFSTGKNVVIIGTGTCSDWGDTESINYFYIAN